MERREAIKYVALSIGSVISLPAWANKWDMEGMEKSFSLLSYVNEKVLDEIVETFIPTTDTKGAKEIGVGIFVQKMIADCYNQQAKGIFKNGLLTVDTTSKKVYGKSFAQTSKEQKKNILKGISGSANEEEKSFYNLVKNLTIQGYLNSEYVMTNLLKYELVPSRFHGCVPVNK